MNALKSVARRTSYSKSDLPMFSGKMDPNLVMEWVDALEGFFECDEIPENHRVKIEKTKLKGATLTLWYFTQGERVKERKNMITSWKVMVTKIKEAYVPEDYEVQLHKKKIELET